MIIMSLVTNFNTMPYKLSIIGYPTHAAFKIEMAMAKTPERVEKFLADLSTKLQLLWKDEKNVMLDMKEAETKEMGLQFDGTLAKEDFR